MYYPVPVFSANTRAFCLYGITEVTQVIQILFHNSSVRVCFVFTSPHTKLMQPFVLHLLITHALLTLCLLQLPAQQGSTEREKSHGWPYLIRSFCADIFSKNGWLIQGSNMSEKRCDRVFWLVPPS